MNSSEKRKALRWAVGSGGGGQGHPKEQRSHSVTPQQCHLPPQVVVIVPVTVSGGLLYILLENGLILSHGMVGICFFFSML
jgi:hypothetical protein